jgi:hypothetical protein
MQQPPPKLLSSQAVLGALQGLIATFKDQYCLDEQSLGLEQ